MLYGIVQIMAFQTVVHVRLLLRRSLFRGTGLKEK